MLEYDIVAGKSIVELKQEANRWLQDSWKPQGGIYRDTLTTFSGNITWYYQAVIKEYGDKSRPEIVCLCGSTKFWREYQKWDLHFTLENKIVLSIGAATGTDDEHFGNLPKTEYDRIKTMLDELHKRKIDLADYVFIINVGGYIGESTRSEIEYAEKLGKRVEYLESI